MQLSPCSFIFMTIEELTTMDNLCEAFYKCARASYWKESTQRFKNNLLLNALELQDDLRKGRYVISPTIDFVLSERGKTRQINAPVIRDRVVQKVLMEKILLPTLSRPLIYDNYASIKGKGVSLARRRMDAHLRRFIREHGSDGYILQVDIRKYFENIDHETMKRLYRKEVHESPEVMALIDYVIDTSSNREKGLNLGSECPQIFAVYYLHQLDTWVKIVQSEHYYGRYVDDMYIISDSKERLEYLLDGIRRILGELKLEVNEKKTHITSLRHGFTYLQMKYNICDGKIVKRPTHDKIARERRRLKAFRRLVDEGRMTETKAYNNYRSWRESVVKDSNACYRSIRNLDILFGNLFPNIVKEPRRTRSELVDELFRSMEGFGLVPNI